MQLFVVIEGDPGTQRRAMSSALEMARRAGWEIASGWVAPLARERVACTGTIRNADDARRALLAAVSGAGLVVRLSAGRELIDRFLDDLRRLGPVRVISDSPAGGTRLTDGQRAILGLMAEGLTVREAAASLGIARSTAGRRLAAARLALGVETSAAAIAAALAERR